MRKLALAAVLALSACAPLTRLEAPEVVNLAVRNVEIRLPTIRVDTELTLRNPNPVEIAVASLDADLEIGGERAGTLRLATGPASLVLGSGATLLPVCCIRRGPGDFVVAIEPALEAAAGRARRDAADDLVRAFAARLEAWVLRQPYMWSGWYQMPTAASEETRLAG